MPSLIRTFVRPTLAVAVAVAALAGAAPQPAPANTSVAVAAGSASILLHFKFYSDYARTNLVGEAYEYCDGTYQHVWGIETSYKRIYDYECGY